MRPTLGKILSGLALVAVTGSMLVMPERLLGTEVAPVQGLELQVPAERMIVRAAPFRPQRVHRTAPVTRPMIVVARRAAVAVEPVAVAISRRLPAQPHAARPKPSPVAKVVAKQPPPPEAAAPPPAAPIEPPEIVVASAGGKKDKAKDDKPRKEKKEKKRKKWSDQEDEGDDGRGEGDDDRSDDEPSSDHD